MSVGLLIHATLALVATPARAADLNVTVAVKQDGTRFVDWRPGDVFTPTPDSVRDPGDDFGPNDGVVRTLDTTTFEITYSVNLLVGETQSGRTRIEATVNGGAKIREGWTPVAGSCPDTTDFPAGFDISPDRTGLVCDTGVFGANSGVLTLDVDVVAPMAMLNGDTFSMSVDLVEIGTPGVDTASSDNVEVSAAPRFDLVKDLDRVDSNISGPGGLAGVRQTWVIGIRGGAADPFGLSALAEPVDVDDLAQDANGVPVHLLGCSVATITGWPKVVTALTGTGSEQLVESAPPTCTQSIPSGPISIRLGGIDWERAAAPPTLAENTAALPAGRTGLVAFFLLETWTSFADMDAADGVPNDGSGLAVVCNTVEALQPGSRTANDQWDPGLANESTWRPMDASGTENLLADRPGGAAAREPVANNGACMFRDFSPALEGATAGKGPWLPAFHGGAVTADTITQSTLFFSSNATPYRPGAALCDKWDNSRFGPEGPGFIVRSGTYTGNIQVEYATGDWGSAIGAPLGDSARWLNQSSTPCSDADIPGWHPESAVDFTNQGLAAVNIDDINAVRITMLDQIPASGTVDLRLRWAMRPGVPFGQEFRNYGAAFFPHARQGAGLWETSDCRVGPTCQPGIPFGLPAGVRSHWWTTIGGTAEVVKTRLGPTSYTAGSRMSSWQVQVRGVPFADQSQPNPLPAGATRQVTLSDTLPAGFSYVPGSTVGLGEPLGCAPASPTPIETQTCVWSLGDLDWMAAPIVFRFDVDISVFSPTGNYVNLAQAGSPDDPRPYFPVGDLRQSTATVDIVGAGGAAIDKVASPLVPNTGDEVTFTLNYANLSGSDIESVDAVDLLPYAGDARTSDFDPGAFVLTGVPVVPAGLQVWLSADDPEALDLADSTRDGRLDPNVVGALGSPQWPCQLAAAGTGSCPALSQVTALRFVGTGTLPQPFLPAGASLQTIKVTYRVGPCGVRPQQAVNSWNARFSGLSLPVRFTAGLVTLPVCGPVPPDSSPIDDGDDPPVEIGPGGDGGTGPLQPFGMGGPLARTGAPIDGMLRQAAYALTVGVVMLVATRRRRSQRREAFAAWAGQATSHDLMLFARAVSARPSMVRRAGP